MFLYIMLLCVTIRNISTNFTVEKYILSVSAAHLSIAMAQRLRMDAVQQSTSAVNQICEEKYSNFRNYAPPPLDVKGGIIAEKVVPVFAESSFLACFGLVM